ncbi:MAG TPA: hypothetical protein VF397_12965 [Pyrinomonadaceae bacterium]
MKPARKKKSRTADTQSNWPGAITAVVVVGLLCLLFFYIWGGRATSSNYEGKIIDRWADYTQSTQGSQPYFRLLVESNDGKRFTVRVDSNIYESARVGMRIKSKDGQVVLIDSGDSTGKK